MDKKTLIYSIIEAIYTFATSEGVSSVNINQAYQKYKESKDLKILYTYESQFDTFTSSFNISRNIPKINKQLIIRKIFDEYLPKLETDPVPEIVQDFAEILKSEGLTHKNKISGKFNLILSATSKVGFIFKPDIFFPYDALTCKALTKFSKISVKNNYLEFYKTIGVYINERTLADQLKEIIINKTYFNHPNIISESKIKSHLKRFIEISNELGIENYYDLLIKRSIDKVLMLEGGHNVNNFISVKNKLIKFVEAEPITIHKSQNVIDMKNNDPEILNSYYYFLNSLIKFSKNKTDLLIKYNVKARKTGKDQYIGYSIHGMKWQLKILKSSSRISLYFLSKDKELNWKRFNQAKKTPVKTSKYTKIVLHTTKNKSDEKLDEPYIAFNNKRHGGYKNEKNWNKIQNALLDDFVILEREFRPIIESLI